VGLPSQLLERRPDLIAADRVVAAAFYGVESARAAQLPRVALSASLGTMLDPTEAIWSIGANLLAPVFTGGRLQGEVQIATAQQRQALSQYVSVALRAFREVESALSNEQVLAYRQVKLERADEMLRSASRIADDRYNAGILNILDLTQVRRQDFANRSQLLRVRAERLRQRLNLHLALGGSFDTRETQP
jgi:outer membrane protein TolC